MGATNVETTPLERVAVSPGADDLEDDVPKGKGAAVKGPGGGRSILICSAVCDGFPSVVTTGHVGPSCPEEVYSERISTRAPVIWPSFSATQGQI